MALIEARSHGEALQYMAFTLVDCAGGGAIEPTVGYVDKQNRAVDVYRVTCPSWDHDLEFQFVVGHKPDDAPGRTMFGFDATPSTLIDVGQFMVILNHHRLWLEAAADGLLAEGLPSPAGGEELLDHVWWARAAAEELLKFIPADADAFPDSAFWTPIGLEMQPTLNIPGFSWRAKLTEYIDEYERTEAALRTRYADAAPEEGRPGDPA